MKKTFLSILPLLALLMLVGCKKATYLKADVENVEIPMEGAADTVILRSDVNDFRLESAPDWVEATLQDSLLIVKAGKNPELKVRKGEVVIANGDLKLQLPVSQASIATYMRIGRKTLTIGNKGEADTLHVETDGTNVRLEGAEGLTCRFADGVLTVSGKPNEGKTRTTKVKLLSDTISQDITIIEKGSVCERCNGSGRINCPVCGGSGITSRFNGAFMTQGPCYSCGGAIEGGSRGRVRCPQCKGSGK